MTGKTPPPTHRVVACRGGDRTEIEERPVPKPGDEELLLRLRVVGLCGTDLYKLGTGAGSPGQVLGHEVVGKIVNKGRRVTRFEDGDRVAVPHHVPCGACHLCRRGAETMCGVFRENLLEPGGFAEYILVRPRAQNLAARKIPDGLPDEAAVFMEPAACVLRGVRRAGADGVGAMLILGAGSMGLLHLLVLKALWPEVEVVVSDPVAERRAHAVRLGADKAVNPSGEAADAIRDMTGGLGAETVFDTVGGAQPLGEGLALSREGGAVVLFAHAPEGGRADFEINDLFKHERRVIGTYSGGTAEQAEIFRLLTEGKLDPAPLATHRLPLDDFERGVELARTRQALKVLFTPSRRSPDA
ncbi:MAG: alcohol dehydrogenase catalytic domain-containing protein [Nitrospinota bacterium]|nr:alcohol dehydrogenase catalytic domain-containing protein [Nitrospinota bacterium]HJM42462.1 alcohol dehydrogenase catalytic domain-containing protein [Nitrospinota bacterium]